jgi:hypothetical protein
MMNISYKPCHYRNKECWEDDILGGGGINKPQAEVLSQTETWRVSYKRQERLTLREHLGSPLVFGVAHLFSFLMFIISFQCMTQTRG